MPEVVSQCLCVLVCLSLVQAVALCRYVSLAVSLFVLPPLVQAVALVRSFASCASCSLRIALSRYDLVLTVSKDKNSKRRGL